MPFLSFPLFSLKKSLKNKWLLDRGGGGESLICNISKVIERRSNRAVVSMRIDVYFLIPINEVTTVSIGRTTYEKLNSNHHEFNLQERQGFFVDLSKVDSIDTEDGILNINDFISNLGTQLLIDEKSKIRDIFTKDGDLIIFNK